MTWASLERHTDRKMIAVKSRRKCHCGCGSRVTHSGTVNGIAMTTGCELHIRRWVKDWRNAIRASITKAPGITEGL